MTDFFPEQPTTKMTAVQTLPINNSPSSTPQGNFSTASLYVGDLPPDVSESTLYDIFSKVGPVLSIRHCRDNVTRQSLGYAYVNYSSAQDAENALDTLNYSPVNGRQIRVMWSHRDPRLRRSGDGNVFVKNLDKSIDNKALHDAFSLFGNILSCKVAVDADGNRKGFGFVHYDSDEGAARAIQEMNNKTLKGTCVNVCRFMKRSERAAFVDSKFTNVYVKNFPDSWEKETLEKIFGDYGSITSMAFQTNHKQQRCAFINFTDNDSARAAVLALNRREIRGDELIMTEEDSEAPASEGNDSSKDENDDRLYVAPHQEKLQRQAMLKAKRTGSGSSVNGDTKVKQQGANLYVKNFDDTVDDDALRSMFSVFGTVFSAKVMKDEKGKSSGFGFVSFLSADDATKALTEMHLRPINGKALYVSAYERKEDRRARLQQQFSTHANSRPHLGGVGQNLGLAYGGGTPHANPYNGPPPSAMGYPARPMMAPFTPGMVSWRNPPQQGAFGQNPGMRPHLGSMGMYPSMNMAGGMPGQNQQPPPMAGPMGRGGGGIRGVRQSGNLFSPVVSGGKPVLSNMHKNYQGNFKFTSQVRNQMDHPHQQPTQQPSVSQSPHETSVPTQPPDAQVSLANLSSLPFASQKQLLGERLFPMIY
ncbi:putative polyadenylate binding protein, partial [Cardiosporidium cionae]